MSRRPGVGEFMFAQPAHGGIHRRRRVAGAAPAHQQSPTKVVARSGRCVRRMCLAVCRLWPFPRWTEGMTIRQLRWPVLVTRMRRRPSGSRSSEVGNRSVSRALLRIVADGDRGPVHHRWTCLYRGGCRVLTSAHHHRQPAEQALIRLLTLLPGLPTSDRRSGRRRGLA